jgi:hypothetical protein
VVEWAFKHAPNTPGKRAKLILMWAKRREAGAFRKHSDEDAEQEIARYWSEHPDKLAETLRKAMNGRS